MTHNATVDKLYTNIYKLSVSDQKNTNIKMGYGGRGDNPYSHFFLAFSYCNLYLKMNKKYEAMMRHNFTKKILSIPPNLSGGYGLTSPA